MRCRVVQRSAWPMAETNRRSGEIGIEIWRMFTIDEKKYRLHRLTHTPPSYEVVWHK